MKRRFVMFFVSLFTWLLASNIDTTYATEIQTIVYSEDYVFEDLESTGEYLNEELLKHSECIIVTMGEELYREKNPSDVFLEILHYSSAYYDTNGGKYSLSYIDGGVKISMYPSYRFTDVQNTELTKAIDEALKGLKIDGKSDYQKVRAIHDYICDNVNYDYTYTNYDSYDAMIKGESVCQGYANLFYRMCYEAGLDARVITGIGNGDGHAWNIVKIGDVYYNIDTTWDGQSDETYYSYFLQNEVDFGDHDRDDKYATDEYYSKYPMADDSWIDWSTVKDNINIENIGNVSFSTIDGGKATNQAENGRGKLLLFGAAGCGLTQQTLINIASSDFSDVDVVFIEANMASMDTVKQIKELYGGSSKDIIYAYDTSYSALFVLYDYTEVLDVTISSFPMLVYIDDENIVRSVDVSVISSANHIRGVVNTWVADQEVAKLSKTSITMDKDTTSQLFITVLGLNRNGQFFTWTSSDESIATVDVNGKITALTAGTVVVTCKVNDELEYSCKVTVLGDTISDGLNKGKDGVWYYYKNNLIDTTYTGLAKNEYGWWYVKNGQLDRTYTGLAKNEYGWWYVKNGQLDRTYTGLAKNEYGWWYVKNGQLDRTYTGLAKNEYGWWYVKNGQLDRTYTGISTNEYGMWYLENGHIATNYIGKKVFNGMTYNIRNGKVISL